jgi:Protein of unknown function (DUF1003)
VLISQNRQAEKDRVRMDIEYEVNIKAEHEVAALHEKTDRIYENMMARFSSLENNLSQTNTVRHVHYSVGVAYAQLGDHVNARQWLARAIATGFPCYPWFERDQLLRPLQGDAEYERMMSELKSRGRRRGQNTSEDGFASKVACDVSSALPLEVRRWLYPAVRATSISGCAPGMEAPAILGQRPHQGRARFIRRLTAGHSHRREANSGGKADNRAAHDF